MAKLQLFSGSVVDVFLSDERSSIRLVATGLAGRDGGAQLDDANTWLDTQTISGVGPNFLLKETDGDADFNIASFLLSSNILNLQTRKNDGTHVSNDIRILKDSAGAYQYIIAIGDVAALTLDSAKKLWCAGDAAFGGRLLSQEITITNDNIGEITAPHTGGFVLIMLNNSNPNVAQSGHFSFDVAASPALYSIGLASSSITNQGATTLTGTTGPTPGTNIAVKADKIVIENRSTVTATYTLTFLG